MVNNGNMYLPDAHNLQALFVEESKRGRLINTQCLLRHSCKVLSIMAPPGVKQTKITFYRDFISPVSHSVYNTIDLVHTSMLMMVKGLFLSNTAAWISNLFTSLKHNSYHIKRLDITVDMSSCIFNPIFSQGLETKTTFHIRTKNNLCWRCPKLVFDIL